MATLHFVKMVAAGNDFVVLDNRRLILKKDFRSKALKLCDRKFGIGADGVLLLEKFNKASIRMRIFNPDGSEADMCGNGVRCLSKFAVDKKIVSPVHTVETGAGTIESTVKNAIVKSRLTQPKDFKSDIKILAGGRTEIVHFLNTGVPHVVIVEREIKELDVDGRGRAVRYHEAFAPKGTNVNFMTFEKGNAIRVRTYERGVEGETLACGTGSTASALIAAKLKGLKSPVQVVTLSGEKLKVYFKQDGHLFKEVYLEGEVKNVFEGSVSI